MTVKEGILAAAGELGIYEEVQAYLQGENSDGARETENLLRCFNLVENELALDYLPLVREEEFQTQTGVLFFSELSRAAVRVLKVTDKWGNEAAFRLFPEYLKTEAQEGTVRYSYAPAQKGLEDESDFTFPASPRLFGYGIAAEYCLANGLFEESAVWEQKYKAAIVAAYRNGRGNGKIQSRRWV